MLTPEKIKALDAATGMQTQPPVNNAGKSRADEIRAMAQSAMPAPSLGENISTHIQDRGEKVYGNITGTSPESEGENPLTRGIQATGNAFGAVADVGGDILGKVIPQGVKDSFKNPKPSPVREAVVKAFSKVSGAVGDNLNKFIDEHPEVGHEIESFLKAGQSLGDISNGILTGEGAASAAQKSIKGVEGGINSVKGTAENVANKAGNYAENSLKADWQKPTTMTKPGYKKATEIYNNAKEGGHDISDTLMKNKISLSDNVEQGYYSTADTAENLRGDAGKMSKEMLRPALEQADYEVPRTPTRDILNDATEHINSNKYITQETKDNLIKKLDETKSALDKKYPDGMSLTEMHDEKIVRDLNAKYSPVGDIATNAEAAKNKALSDSLRGLVEEKAPPEIPVEQFNAELTKQFQAADYLDSLNAKRVPTSVASRIAKTTAKVVGASIGSGLGGGILGGVGGYHVGGMIEGLLESLPNPLKVSFLKNLETTNPEAFSAVNKYLATSEAENASRLALPEPSYMEMGANTPSKSGVEILPAQKNPVSANPTSGKFQTSYSSSPVNLSQSPSVAAPKTSISKNVNIKK